MVKQEHEGVPLISRHSALGPHGDGTQGFTNIGLSGGGGGAVKIKIRELSV